MDPINILVCLNIAATFGANLSTAKRSFVKKNPDYRQKPKTYLQALPVTLATFSLVLIILAAIFQVGTLGYTTENQDLRIAGLIVYITFSWIQILSQKTLGENFSQEIILFRNHKLIKNGIYKYIRHPFYLSQILADLGASVATLGYIVLLVAIINIPFLIMRGIEEEKLFKKYFKEEFDKYRSRSGFMIPFL